MAPAMPYARVRPRRPSRLFSRIWQTRSRAQGCSDNSSTLRSLHSPIFPKHGPSQWRTARHAATMALFDDTAVPGSPGQAAKARRWRYSSVLERGVTSGP
jgi:hypothetical protein